MKSKNILTGVTYALLVGSCLIALPDTTAAASCAVTAPQNWSIDFDFSAPLTTEVISDCTNPFNINTTDSGVYAFKVNGVPVENNGVIVTEPTNDYAVTGREASTMRRAILFKHEGLDFRYTSMEEVEPTTRQDFESLAAAFFTNGEDYSPYVDAVVSGQDDMGSDEANAILSDFQSFIMFNWQKPKLEAGTFTLVIQISDLYLTKEGSWWRSFLPEIAYADTVPRVYAITFTLAAVPPQPAGASSVLFLPGIQASRLYKSGLFGTESQIWEPDGNQDVRQLAMATSGTSIESVYTRDIPGEVYYGYTNIYGGFSNYMDSLVTRDIIAAWTPFAYDWRYSVEDIAANGTRYEHEARSVVDEIERLASSSFSGKVTIIGHSNGGLLAKAVMLKLAALGKSDLVDTVVFLASPQLGTPKAIASLLHGYDQELGFGYIVDDMVARVSMQNMPGAYGLVPSEAYFRVATSDLISFDTATGTKVFRDVYGESITTTEELVRFMTGVGDSRPEATTLDEAMRVNGALLQNEQSIHNTSLDAWRAPTGVRVVEIVGTGLDTVRGFEYRSFKERVCTSIAYCATVDSYKPVPLFTSQGDKTVVGISATGYSGEKEQYFVDLKKIVDVRKDESVEHYNIGENPSIQKLVTNILQKTTSTIDFITEAPVMPSDDRLVFGVHSPVTLEVKDAAGRRVGRGVVRGVPVPITDIPQSSYIEIGSSTYVVVPQGVTYQVVVQGTGQGGLTFTMDTLKGDEQNPAVSVRVATITPSTTVSVTYTGTTLTNLAVDQNADGVPDQVLTPQGVDVTPKVTYTTLKTAVQKITLSPVRKAVLLALVSAAEAFDKNPKLAPLEAQALKELENLLATYQKNKWISATDVLALKGIISKLK